MIQLDSFFLSKQHHAIFFRAINSKKGFINLVEEMRGIWGIPSFYTQKVNVTNVVLVI